MADVIVRVVNNRAVVQVAGAEALLRLAALATQENADRAEAALQEIQDIASGAPDAPSVLNKVNLNGDNIPSAPVFRDAVGAKAAVDVPMEYDGRAGNAGGFMTMDYRLRIPSEVDGRFIGGIWSGRTYARHTMEAKFSALTAPDGEFSPAANLFLYTENTGAPGDVCSLLSITYATANDTHNFGLNVLVGCPPGITGFRGVVAEFDYEPSAGVAAGAGSAGLFVNAFSFDGCGPALQTGGVGAGKWTNGIIIGEVTATGAGLAPSAGQNMGSLVNTGSQTYNSGAAIIVTQGHVMRLAGPAGVNAERSVDGSGALIERLSSGPLVILSGAGAQIGATSQAGDIAVGASASISAGYKLDVAADSAAEGVGIIQAKSSTAVASLQAFVALGTAANAAAAALKVGTNSVTGRSINAGGTINNAGADYAEVEELSADMLANGRVFAKGDIVGFDATGFLTDRFAEAVSFAVKSTAPSLVGGDRVGLIDEPPALPTFVPPEYAGAKDPGPTPKAPERGDDWAAHRKAMRKAKATGVYPDELMRTDRHYNDIYQTLQDEWEAAKAKARADFKAHQGRVAKAKRAFEKTEIRAYEKALAAWSERANEVRKPFDRVAYCGKVPVNVTGANAGDWIVPAQDDGRIVGVVVKDSELTRMQERLAVGRVRRVLDDGRAEIAVKGW